jgi:putative lipoprotein
MSLIDFRALILAGAAAAVVIGTSAEHAMAQTISGTATYRERMALPPGAVLEAAIEDVSKADAPALVVASTRVESPGNPPIAFTIAYDKAKIVGNHRYVVRAKILLDGKLLFTSDTVAPVITQGNPTKVSLMLRRVIGSETAQAKPGPGATPPGSALPLEATYWKAIEFQGMPVPASREAHLVFQVAGRLAGSDGCNRITGSYELKGDGISFGQLAGTQMACPDTAEVERRFRAALKGTSHWRIKGNRLEFRGATAKPLAVFQGRAQTPYAPSKLQGTAWQLVKFQSSDDTTLTPDDRSKYTIEFAAAGRLTARIDCNKGRGTWKSSGDSHLEFGPLALTRAKCPEGSLHDRIVKHWGSIRSYVIRDGHLFLALMADGGIYEFEPLRSKP